MFSGIFIRYFTLMLILIPSLILWNSRSYSVGILKCASSHKALRRLCAIIAVVYNLSNNYILTNNNYDAVVHRTRDLIVGGT